MSTHITPELIRTAIELVNQEQSQSSVAKSLGLNQKTVNRWCVKERVSLPEKEQQEKDEIRQLKIQLQQAKAEIEFLKKSRRVLCQIPQLKYAFLKYRQEAGDFGKEQHLSTRTAAKLLKISVSVYYRWQQSDPNHPYGAVHSESKLIALLKDIIRTAGKQVLGLMRIYLALRTQGIQICFKRLRRLVRENGIFLRFHHKYVATTTSSASIRLGAAILRTFRRMKVGFIWQACWI